MCAQASAGESKSDAEADADAAIEAAEADAATNWRQTADLVTLFMEGARKRGEKLETTQLRDSESVSLLRPRAVRCAHPLAVLNPLP